ncbi:MAG: carbohydrate kinase [Rhodospirillaceae bacterium]|nr:carbohydrate kinase [Rhodospirillaceae bacterium]
MKYKGASEMLAVGGENLIDFVSSQPAGNGLPNYRANPGGAPFNAAMAVGLQGQAVVYLTPISTDALGELLANRLVDCGVTVAAPRVLHPTSLAVVSVGPDGGASYAFHRNGTAERQVTVGGLDSWLPAATQIFYVGGLALVDGADGDVWEDFFMRCKARGILTAIDANVRPALILDRDSYLARLRRMMKKADIFKLSNEDLLWIYPDHVLDAALEMCRAECDAALFILTMGPDGARGFAGGADITVPATPVPQMVDTVGAGDTFMASILAWALDTGRTDRAALNAIELDGLETVMRRATQAASINCARQGCNPPTRAELGLL